MVRLSLAGALSDGTTLIFFIKYIHTASIFAIESFPLDSSDIMAVDKLSPTDLRVQHCTADLNGKTYHYLLGKPEGEPRATIFLIHGWPDLSFGWRYQIPLLVSLGLRVVVPDMMGYGGTDAPDSIDFYTYKRAADDMAELARQLDAPQIMLGGHDWGGAIVYRIALHYPSLITSVFSICTPYFAPRKEFIDLPTLIKVALPNFTYQLQLRGPDVENAIQGKEKLREFFNAMYGGRGPNGEAGFDPMQGVLLDRLPNLNPTPLLSSEELDFYTEQYSRNGMHGPLNWYRTFETNVREEVALAERGAKIECPTMFVQATRDGALPPKMAAGMDAHFDNKLVRREVEASHWALWEKSAECNEYIKEWVEQQLSSGSKSNL
jgi:soluble epoxide hydrolase/lipid-phosphate phosphatase